MLGTYLIVNIDVMFSLQNSSSFKDSAFSVVNLTQSFGSIFIISFVFLTIVFYRPCNNAFAWDVE